MPYSETSTLVYPKVKPPKKKTRWAVEYCITIDGEVERIRKDYLTKVGARYAIWFWCVFKEWLTHDGAYSAILIERTPEADLGKD